LDITLLIKLLAEIAQSTACPQYILSFLWCGVVDADVELKAIRAIREISQVGSIARRELIMARGDCLDERRDAFFLFQMTFDAGDVAVTCHVNLQESSEYWI
jgi:hypothetical protein